MKLLFVGSGAVQNAWLPVFRALSSFLSRRVEDVEVANLVMAKMVFEHQFLIKMVLRCEENDRPRVEAALNQQEAKIDDFRQILSREILVAEANSETPLRGNQTDGVHLEKDIAIITTNWTDNFAKTFRRRPIFLHGNASDHSDIYLPLSSSQDQFRFDRPNTLGNRHAEALKLMNEATHIYIWGLGINSLDGELTLLLTHGFKYNRSSFKVTILDLKPGLVKEKLIIFGVPEGNIDCIVVS